MGLSRLDNFLKNSKGDILYVDPSSIDSTDSIENQGNSLVRPFKTIQRALLEAARFSYQKGLDNDRFSRTTIIVYPGEHVIDNRPGWIPVHDDPLTGNNWLTRSGSTSNALEQFTLDANFDIDDPENDLYKMNSVYGGVIIPRGTSIVGMDLRKTKIRPMFVPDPADANIKQTCLFRVTGTCYFYQFTFFDANPNSSVFKDYGLTKYVPNYSHHKVTCFEYADGVNNVGFNDSFLNYSSERTDLDIYYEKIGLTFGPSSGRDISPDFPSIALDIQTKVDEFRIVGSKGQNVGINSIKAGDGVNSSTTIEVELTQALAGLDVNTPIRIEGVPTGGYNGSFVISEVQGPTKINYEVSNPPSNALPSIVAGAPTLNIVVDSVTSASPYIFNCSLRSVYGMCGLHADGSKADGFKSMVVAQFTGIGLQKDDTAFVKYNAISGVYEDSTAVNNLHTDTSAIYKPDYENFHIKASNDSFLQLVSVFAIGYANHFVAESGGDHSVTNSNSNFGARALVCSGFRNDAFPRDDTGFITHIIPPQKIDADEVTIEFASIDVQKTIDAANDNRLYLYNEVNQNVPPKSVLEGYRIGAKIDDRLKVIINENNLPQTKTAKIIMPDTQGTGVFEVTSTKLSQVGRTAIGINSITSNIFTLTQGHQFKSGESLRVLSDDGELPDGLDHNRVYYAITAGINTDQIKLAQTLNDTISASAVTVNSKGGILQIESRVSDKKSGDIGHPVQYDTNNNNWYVRCSIDPAENTIYQGVVDNQLTLGPRTNKAFFERREDTRSLNDRIYKLRYVIPKEEQEARAPIPGYILQESSTVGVTTASDFTDTIPNATVLRNLRILKSVDRDSNSGVTTFVSEKPHDLMVGDRVLLRNIKSSGNTVGAANTGYNIRRSVVGVTSSKGFEVNFSNDPGSFITNVSTRNASLPTFSKETSKATYLVYRIETLKEHEFNKQDGVYHLICIDGSISPTVNEFGSEKFNQQIENLYPQFDADNFLMNPAPSASFAVASPIGKVVTNNLQYSVTREFTNRYLNSIGAGIAVTFAEGSTQGISTIYLDREHNLNQITSVGIGSSGFNYGTGISTTLYNATLQYSGAGTGDGATVNIDVDANGGITDVTIVDGGSAYAVNDVLRVVGVQTNPNHIVGTLTVNKTSNNIGDAIEVVGVGTSIARYRSGYNGIHTVTAVTPTTISYDNGFWPGYYDVNTVGMQTGFVMYAGPVPSITNVVYSSAATGIVTVTTAGPHGLNVNNPFKIVGVAQTIYNYETIVRERLSTTQFTFKFNDKFNPATYTAGGSVIPINYDARGGKTEAGNERIAQRHAPLRTGIQTSMSASSINTTTTTLTLADSAGFHKGDYVQIDGEIIRIASDFSANAATVLRGQMGSRSASHDASSMVKKIKIIATEKRRHSILRASGHTFEYLGFGPGNYSTGLPQKQSRVLSKEEQFLSQSQTPNGGAVVYTGMNDAGDFYIGNKVINSQDGTETTFNIPVPQTVGAAEGAAGAGSRLDAIFDSVTIREGLSVDGLNNTTVRFNAPTTVTEKLTSTSTDGAEFVQIDINGGLTENRTLTFSPTKPVATGTLGDLTFNSSPSFGQYLGWVFTNQGWKRFGLISTEDDETKLSLQTVGVGSTGADRIGQQDGIDVRGTIVADAFVCAGVCTFSGATTFASIVFSEATIGVGTITDRLDVQSDANFSGVTTARGLIIEDATVSNGKKLFLGTGRDLEIYHNGTQSAIDNKTGHLYIRNNVDNDDNSNIYLQAKSGEDGIIVNDDGSVQLYHNNALKLATQSTGINVTGQIEGTVDNADNINIDGKNDNVNYQVTFSDAGDTGYNRQYIDSGAASQFTYNPSTNTLSAGTFNGSGASLTNIPNSATTATNSNNPNTIVARDGSGNFSAGTINASLEGNADSATNVRVDTSSSNTAFEIVFSDGTSTSERLRTDSSTGNFTYNPSTNELNVSGKVDCPEFEGTADVANQLFCDQLDTNATYYLLFVGGTSDGNKDVKFDNQLSYNASTNILIVGSDERWKTGIRTIEKPLEKVQQLRGVTYEWKDSGDRTYGLIAQEVEKVIPELVDTDEEGYKGVGYQNMVSVLIEAVKEQQTQIDALKAKVDELSK